MDKFRIGDLVSVTFSGIQDATTQLPPHEETIKEDGTVTLPLIGSVQALGRTAGELQKEIHTRYEQYYPRLNVNVKPAPRSYTVGGEVKMAGPKFWEPGTTVIKAIQAAGDFTDFAKKTKVKLTRASDGTVITVNCKKAIKDPRLDPLVFPGDVIHVPRRIL
jgi:protein involved in polysaccharide export with SLBB domain